MLLSKFVPGASTLQAKHHDGVKGPGNSRLEFGAWDSAPGKPHYSPCSSRSLGGVSNALRGLVATLRV
jgi:hypothetical protein